MKNNVNDIVRLNDLDLRILSIEGDKCLVVDCVKMTMPYWLKVDELEKAEPSAFYVKYEAHTSHYENHTHTLKTLRYGPMQILLHLQKNPNCETSLSTTQSFLLW